uniref:Uncharacterized protein n=1 Tax=Arundo donax TaxID=35708 RepID=A0A0A9GI07_ARUDO
MLLASIWTFLTTERQRPYVTRHILIFSGVHKNCKDWCENTVIMLIFMFLS